MNFTITKVLSSNERLGVLTGFSRIPDAVIETPACAFLTQGGSVVHLTSEVLSKVISKPHLMWLPLSNSVHLENGVKAQGEGVAKFVGLPDQIFCATLSNMNEATPIGHMETDSVPIWTKQGKKMINADRYMDIMEVLKPDLIMTIADSKISLSDGPKRNCKAVERTCALLDKCVKRYKESKELQNSSLIGVIVGAGDAKRCDHCIQHVLAQQETLKGVALSSLTDGSEESYCVAEETMSLIFKRVAASLPQNLFRIVEGGWNPSIIVSAIEYGWDIFDGSYTVKLSNAGKALVMNYDVYDYKEHMCILDLNDIRYKEDFRPVQIGCECLTCCKHKRAYIRHLLNTREMLATVLLSIHNLHNFNQLFENARKHIAANTFTVFKNHIKKQYNYYVLNSRTIDEFTEEIECKKKDTPVKKKRVSNGDIPVKLVNGTC